MNLGDLTFSELKQYIEDAGESPFRAKQIYKWVHGGCLSYDEMTNVPKSIREKLALKFEVYLPSVYKKLESAVDGTVKYLLRLSDGNIIETVVMDYHHGKSICVSSQVGCRMGCSFCASTIGGLIRNLSPFEIEGQVLRAAKDLNTRITNIVIMGIGEPLDNYDNVLKFLHNINSADGANIGMRHITLSTCGIPDKIRLLADENLGLNLALSLHAPSGEKRKAIMPVAKSFSLESVLSACDYYFEKTHRRVTFEYALVKGKNASEEDALALGRLLEHKNCHINLIPVNPVSERNNTRTSPSETAQFVKTLEKFGINTTVRREMGPDINAACGQLRNNEI